MLETLKGCMSSKCGWIQLNVEMFLVKNFHISVFNWRKSKITKIELSISNKRFELRRVSDTITCACWVVLGLTIKFYFEHDPLSYEAEKGKISKFNQQNNHFWTRKMHFFWNMSRNPKITHIKYIQSYFEFLKNMHLTWFSYFCSILENSD